MPTEAPSGVARTAGPPPAPPGGTRRSSPAASGRSRIDSRGGGVETGVTTPHARTSGGSPVEFRRWPATVGRRGVHPAASPNTRRAAIPAPHPSWPTGRSPGRLRPSGARPGSDDRRAGKALPMVVRLSRCRLLARTADSPPPPPPCWGRGGGRHRHRLLRRPRSGRHEHGRRRRTRRRERRRPFARETFVSGVGENVEECRAKTYLNVDVPVRDFAIGVTRSCFPALRPPASPARPRKACPSAPTRG